MKLFKKNDLFLISGLLLVFLLIILVLGLSKRTGSAVQVSVDGVVKETFPLSENREYIIEGYDKGTNTLVIEDGKAWVKDTSCPDHLCEKMGKISSVGQSIICLPNRVVVEIVGDDAPEYDAVIGG